jgi:phosphoribosylglycinamide formyltransferase 1
MARADPAGRDKCRTAVLISGRGSNLQALIEGCRRPGASGAIALVVSNVPEAGGLEHARAAGIPTRVIDHRTFGGRREFEKVLSETLEASAIDLVCLAGFMRVLSSWFVERWRDRLLNIHPSLLPAFPGLHTHERALEAGVRFHGCTVHFVRAELDAGPIVVQGTVPVRPDDTTENLLSLGARAGRLRPGPGDGRARRDRGRNLARGGADQPAGLEPARTAASACSNSWLRISRPQRSKRLTEYAQKSSAGLSFMTWIRPQSVQTRSHKPL